MTEREDWDYERIRKQERTNDRILKINKRVEELHREREEIIRDYKRWFEEHKRREPPKTGYPARTEEYIKGRM